MITTFPNRRYNQGTETIGPVGLPVNATRAEVRLTRSAWPDIGSPVLSIQLEISLDGGLSWGPFVGAEMNGGDILARDGSIMAESTIVATLPDETNPARQVRGVITLNRALNSAITLAIT
jgi:hypothetical protein